jgi:hypothetical protein
MGGGIIINSWPGIQQGISWLVRKAIGLATVTLKLTQVSGISPSTSNPTIEITVLQSTGTSLGATTDKLYLDWTVLAREDHIFGKTTAQARFVLGAASEGKSRPQLEIQTTIEDANIAKFLKGEIDEDGEPCEGFLVEVPKKDVLGVNGQQGLWTHVVIKSQDSKWTAEQVRDLTLLFLQYSFSPVI